MTATEIETDDPIAYWQQKHAEEAVVRSSKRASAADEFDNACKLAADSGFRLTRMSDAMYQLWGPNDAWLINVYPGHCRLHSPKNLLAPFLYVEKGAWTITEVVWAAIEAQERMMKRI